MFWGEGGLGKMNIGSSLQKKLQVGGLFFGVPRIYDCDCNFTSIEPLFQQQANKQ